MRSFVNKYRFKILLVSLTITVLVSFFCRPDASFGNSTGTLTDSTDLPVLAESMARGDFSSPAHADVYTQLNLAKAGLGSKAFEVALKGWEKLKSANQLVNESLLSIVDFSQPSTHKRLYIIDMKKQLLLYQTYVAHGRNSGKEQAVNFSNNPSSNKSSPGFYRTEKTYYGSNGYSLRLAGLEKGINDNAESRAIVMHGAGYVNESIIRNLGYLGRSQGCPAIPLKLTRPIINTIRNGSCLFIYAPATYYAQNSDLIN